MQEFSSISVSSYEAGALADRLTDQSRAGWTVVSIVPTGSTITAYLCRDGDGQGDGSGGDHGHTEPTSRESTPEPMIPDATPAHVPAASEPDPEPVAANEAAGWGSGSDVIMPEAAHDVAPSIPTVADVSPEPAPMPAAAEPIYVPEPEPQPEPEPEPVAVTETAVAETAAAGAAPAGWYADPSSRFELRYWDGGQWTEHVSRSGQQYTDPPVA
jgi:hypothetical protein